MVQLRLVSKHVVGLLGTSGLLAPDDLQQTLVPKPLDFLLEAPMVGLVLGKLGLLFLVWILVLPRQLFWLGRRERARFWLWKWRR